MSHYTVGIITDNLEKIDEMLKPYDENIKVEPYIVRTKEQIIKDAKERKERFLKEKEEGKELDSWKMKYINANTDEELYKAKIDEFGEYDEEGNELSSYNPNSKWDWYEIGGRWHNLLLVKENVNTEIDGKPSLFNLDSNHKEAPKGYKWCDIAKIKDIELDEMIQGHYEKEKRFWELVVEKQQPQNEDEEEIVKWNLYKPEYYTERYSSKEEYAKWQSMFSTFAMLNEQGWFEKGKMGWFACDTSTGDSERDFIKFFNDELKKPENQEKYLVIVDCHI